MKYEVKKNKKLTDVKQSILTKESKGTAEKYRHADYAMPFNFGSRSKKLYQPKNDDSFLQPDRTFWYNDNYDRF